MTGMELKDAYAEVVGLAAAGFLPDRVYDAVARLATLRHWELPTAVQWQYVEGQVAASLEMAVSIHAGELRMHGFAYIEA